MVSVAALGVFGVGLYLVLLEPHQWAMLAAGCACLVAVGVTWPIAHGLSGFRNDQSESRELTRHIDERLNEVHSLVGRVSESQLLSDRAKSVAFREKDRDAIRRAIGEEMSRAEWEAAYAWPTSSSRRLGRKSEADRLRGEINERRSEGVRQEIAEVVAVIDRHVRNEQWTAAVREAERLHDRFPSVEQVRQLPGRHRGARQSHKKQLLQSWHEAVARHDVDGSIEILKNLDSYLTPAEAESMQDTARGVFKEKLSNLVSQFGNSIRDHRWTEAVRVGEQIQAEFPNSRAAQEVKEKMDMLRQRASEPAAATA